MVAVLVQNLLRGRLKRLSHLIEVIDARTLFRHTALAAFLQLDSFLNLRLGTSSLLRYRLRNKGAACFHNQGILVVSRTEVIDALALAGTAEGRSSRVVFIRVEAVVMASGTCVYMHVQLVGVRIVNWVPRLLAVHQQALHQVRTLVLPLLLLDCVFAPIIVLDVVKVQDLLVEISTHVVSRPRSIGENNFNLNRWLVFVRLGQLLATIKSLASWFDSRHNIDAPSRNLLRTT